MLDEAEPVAQPLDRGAGDEHAALERVGRLATRTAGGRGEHAARRLAARWSPVIHQEERAGAVGVLRQPGVAAALPEQRRLLVAGEPGDREGEPQVRRVGLADDPGGGDDAGQQFPGHAEDGEQLRVPVARAEIVEQRAATRWCDRSRGPRPPVSRATSQLSTVPAASSPRSARRRSSGSRSSHSSLVAEK